MYVYHENVDAGLQCWQLMSMSLCVMEQVNIQQIICHGLRVRMAVATGTAEKVAVRLPASYAFCSFILTVTMSQAFVRCIEQEMSQAAATVASMHLFSACSLSSMAAQHLNFVYENICHAVHMHHDLHMAEPHMLEQLNSVLCMPTDKSEQPEEGVQRACFRSSACSAEHHSWRPDHVRIGC